MKQGHHKLQTCKYKVLLETVNQIYATNQRLLQCAISLISFNTLFLLTGKSLNCCVKTLHCIHLQGLLCVWL